MILESLLGIGGKLIDKLIPDPTQKAEAQLKLAQMAQDGELAKMANETRLRELELADGQSAHSEQQDTIKNGDNASVLPAGACWCMATMCRPITLPHAACWAWCHKSWCLTRFSRCASLCASSRVILA